MKKLFTVFSIAFTAVCVNAQPIVTSSWAPAVNDVQHVQYADTTGISEGAAGPNVTWNFSGLTDKDTIMTTSYVSPVGTTYASDFPAANIASYVSSSTSGNSGYSYFISNSSSLRFLGLGTSAYTYKASDPMTQMVYPFTYNSTYTDSTVAGYTANGVDVFRFGTQTNTGDAYGTITTPAGIFSNVLRIKVVQNYWDTFEFMGSVIGTAMSEITSYLWVSPSNKNPIAQVFYISQTQQGQTSTSKSVYYYPFGPTGLAEGKVSDARFGVFPNPANDVAYARFNLGKSSDVKFEITDLSGRLVKSEEAGMISAGDHNVKLETANLDNGFYFVNMLVNNKYSGTFKLQLNH